MSEARVPDGWTKILLADEICLQSGFPFKSQDFSNQNDKTLPLVRIRDLRKQVPDVHVLHNFDECYRVKNGDFLVGMDGEFIAVRWSGGDAALNQRVLKFAAKGHSIDSEFLFYRLQPELNRLEGTISGTTVKHLSTKHLNALHLSVPPLSEQRRIAEILSSVDDAIAATQAVLDQTRTVKQAVLKRLLTKGIGHTRFKQTEIGEIPEAWEVVSLESLLASTSTPMRSGPFGSALKKDELVEEGIPFLGIDNVQVEYFSDTFKRFVTPEKFDELRRFAVRPHDVMITIMGTVGRCCVVPESIGSALSSKHVWTMTFDQMQYFPELICWQLNSAPWVLQKFDKAAQGGVMGAINSQVLKGLELPKPPIEEQKVILTVWQSFNDALYTEETKLKALIQTKSALMSDLLTGRQRVPAALLSAAG